MEITQTLKVRTRSQWRRWLERNHSKTKEVWIIYPKKHTGKKRIAYYDAVDEALCFGWIDSTVKRIDDDHYCQRFSPRRARSMWSATNAARYQILLKDGHVTEAGKRVFASRGGIVEKREGEVGAYAWHLAHVMGPHPTQRKRLAWHREHQRVCGCRPVPKALQKYFKGDRVSDSITASRK